MKFLFRLTFFFIFTFSHAQSVRIPDKNFERALIEKGIDSDKKVNGFVLSSDVKPVVFLSLYNKKIRSLEGIQAFTSLQYLDCRKNNLSAVDVSQNIALTSFRKDVNNVIKTNNIFNLMAWFE
ncbi:hypothetical protein [Mariniflexile sp. AS56]|uniref:hypothetical protein n=1 Tax=Mariniflexile sp. AS56 TaxID=3063957 RepID=UPI0026EC4242|nr:hypothetical protein [Mariniflexile sp. AS56]MDO7172760.1 hypothetical protein [Mariniflexile sp. AS56]